MWCLNEESVPKIHEKQQFRSWLSREGIREETQIMNLGDQKRRRRQDGKVGKSRLRGRELRGRTRKTYCSSVKKNADRFGCGDDVRRETRTLSAKLSNGVTLELHAARDGANWPLIRASAGLVTAMYSALA
eukprot:1303288-Pleurochrysis_carterae.AAC.1